MLKLFASSSHRFGAVDEARALVDFWCRVSKPPQRFGLAEPVREALPGREGEAARLLATEGMLLLARAKPGATWMFTWHSGGLAQWYVELALAAAPPLETWAAFFQRFPVAWAGVAPAAHWQARHWQVEELDDGGEVETKVGLDLHDGLPGVLWVTAFGAAAVAHFGRQTLLSLPVERALDLGDAGVLLQTDARPPPGPLPGPRERAVLDALGRDHFFDISDPARPRRPIPGLPR